VFLGCELIDIYSQRNQVLKTKVMTIEHRVIGEQMVQDRSSEGVSVRVLTIGC